LSFGFPTGSVVNVTFSSFVFPIPSAKTVPTGLPFSNVCYLDIWDNSLINGYSTLGLGFLRLAYTVYDLSNHRIGIAQSVLNTSLTHIVEVQAGAASIPQATGVPLPTPTPSPTSNSSSNSTSGSSSNPKPKSHGVAIGVGVAVPVIAILAGLFGFFFWRRRRHTSSEGDAPPPPAFIDNKHGNIAGISELPESSTAGSPEPVQGRFEGGSLSPNRSSLPVYSPYQGGESRPMSPTLSEVQGYDDSGSPKTDVGSAIIFK